MKRAKRRGPRIAAWSTAVDLLLLPAIAGPIAQTADQRWFLKKSHSDGHADVVFTYGNFGDKLIVGDWNG